MLQEKAVEATKQKEEKRKKPKACHSIMESKARQNESTTLCTNLAD
jgi:hypothetical protein